MKLIKLLSRTFPLSLVIRPGLAIPLVVLAAVLIFQWLIIEMESTVVCDGCGYA